MNNIIVIGLDGAHWELIDKWIDAGELPNIAKLRDRGAWGDLDSQLPPVTSPNWKCYSTGKNPGKLGVYWWEVVDTSSRDIYTPFADDYQSRELWDYIGERGGTTHVINVPTTYPPRDIEGAMIAGGPTAEETGYATPTAFEDTLEKEFGYRVRATINLQTDPEQGTEERIDLIRSRFEVARHLLERDSPEFLQVTVFQSNVLHHFLWDDPLVLEAWRAIDDEIGRLVEDYGDEYDFLVMSDHGSNEIHTEFNINSWLEAEGYLKTEQSATDLLSTLGVTRQNAKQLLHLLPNGESLKHRIPRRLKEHLPTQDGVVKKEGKVSKIDWERSQAIASGQGPVYLLTENEDERERLRTELVQKLEVLIDERGEPIIKNAFRAEDIYSGELKNAPDIVLEQAPNVHISGGIGSESPFTQVTEWRAENKDTGLFIFDGEDVRSEHIGRMDIVDLAPTILHWMGLPVVEDMGGRTQKQIFTPESGPARADVETVAPTTFDGRGTEMTDEDVQERLQDLGYLAE